VVTIGFLFTEKPSLLTLQTGYDEATNKGMTSLYMSNLKIYFSCVCDMTLTFIIGTCENDFSIWEHLEKFQDLKWKQEFSLVDQFFLWNK
jgi:hypothetical protein